jgi:hypothetical protein
MDGQNIRASGSRLKSYSRRINSIRCRSFKATKRSTALLSHKADARRKLLFQYPDSLKTRKTALAIVIMESSAKNPRPAIAFHHSDRSSRLNAAWRCK